MPDPTTTTALATTPKAGGQPGNANNLRHGLRAGALPAGCRHIQRATDELRQALEAATMQAKGEVSITDAASINTATRAERLATLAQRWLRINADTMDHATRLAYAREVVKASETRDRAIRSLGLSTDPLQAIKQKLYGKHRHNLEAP